MINYDYTGIAVCPNMGGIQADVALSAMTNKSIEYCEWIRGDELLKSWFTVELSGEDKILLDAIVASNL